MGEEKRLACYHVDTNTCLTTTPAAAACVGWRLIMSSIVFWPPLRALDLKEMAGEKLHASLIILGQRFSRSGRW
jgi:hypothetical protein